MRNLILCLCLVISSAFIFSWFEVDQKVHQTVTMNSVSDGKVSIISKPFSGPKDLVEANADHIEIKLEGNGYYHTGVLDIGLASGEIFTTRNGADPWPTRKECTSSSPCRLLVKISPDEPTSVVISAKLDRAVIDDINFEVATAKRASELSPGLLLYVFVILAGLGPFIVWARRYNNLDKFVLSGLGLSWLAWAGAASFLSGIVFAIVSYLAITTLAKSNIQKNRRLLTFVLIVVFVIVFLKFLAPISANAFANPGGFTLALPLGISYFAIKIIDLLLAAHSRTLQDFTPIRFIAFLFLPHTLAAGPIFTYENFLQSRIEGYTVIDFAAGLARMLVGFSKKLVADGFVLPIVGNSMASFLIGGGEFDENTVLTMLLFNVIYVYLDFSAYSDIAIGSGRTAGIRVPENFNWPLFNGGILEYWRRWHMTLSNWVMRRVYFPVFLTSRSVFLSTLSAMLVIGMWHTPNVAWMLWALHHSVGMFVEGKYISPTLARYNKAIPARMLGLYHVVLRVIAFVLLLIWVGLGHSFTLFSSIEISLRAYFTAVGTLLGINL